jgi:hypothetical protein
MRINHGALQATIDNLVFIALQIVYFVFFKTSSASPYPGLYGNVGKFVNQEMIVGTIFVLYLLIVRTNYILNFKSSIHKLAYVYAASVLFIAMWFVILSAFGGEFILFLLVSTMQLKIFNKSSGG